MCRTCLKASSTDDYIELNFTTNPSHTSIREKLKSCVPEMVSYETLLRRCLDSGVFKYNICVVVVVVVVSVFFVGGLFT